MGQANQPRFRFQVPGAVVSLTAGIHVIRLIVGADNPGAGRPHSLSCAAKDGGQSALFCTGVRQGDGVCVFWGHRPAAGNISGGNSRRVPHQGSPGPLPTP